MKRNNQTKSIHSKNVLISGFGTVKKHQRSVVKPQPAFPYPNLTSPLTASPTMTPQRGFNLSKDNKVSYYNYGNYIVTMVTSNYMIT